jgi:bifunctional DNA-binding transcriptional regulator/antitoxin component of YhaV-PrlF toxin-antitoxin module
MTEKPTSFTARLLTGGKVTVPVELRYIYNLVVDDTIEFEIKRIIKEETVVK